MGTTSSEIVDLFLSHVDDYRYGIIEQSSGSTVLTIYLEPFLFDAIDTFSDLANQDLTYVESGSSLVEGYFVQDLNRQNKDILSQLMVKSWLAKNIQNLLQMQNHIDDRDMKTFSPAANLKAKQDFFNSKCEELDRMLTQYSYKNNINWQDWFNQNFNNFP